MNAWRDVSKTLDTALPAWPGDTPFALNWDARMDAGAQCDVSSLCMSSHFGTHMDAQAHFVPGGRSIDAADTELLAGEAFLVDARAFGREVGPQAFEDLPRDARRVLVRTINETRLGDTQFFMDYAALTLAAVEMLAARGVALVGTDGPAFALAECTAAAHRLFLAEPHRLILENADFSGLSTGWYDLVCLPLKVRGAEGAPARAMVRATNKAHE